MKKSKKKFFIVTVINEMFGQFSQEFFTTSGRRARRDARTWFSLELGQDPEDIEVLKTEEGRLSF